MPGSLGVLRVMLVVMVGNEMPLAGVAAHRNPKIAPRPEEEHPPKREAGTALAEQGAEGQEKLRSKRNAG